MAMNRSWTSSLCLPVGQSITPCHCPAATCCVPVVIIEGEFDGPELQIELVISRHNSQAFFSLMSKSCIQLKWGDDLEFSATVFFDLASIDLEEQIFIQAELTYVGPFTEGQIPDASAGLLCPSDDACCTAPPVFPTGDARKVEQKVKRKRHSLRTKRVRSEEETSVRYVEPDGSEHTVELQPLNTFVN